MDERYLAEIDYNLDRGSTFSYQCNACTRCCHHNIIAVGPYEILRLARHFGITTTDFIAQHTEAGGTALRRREEEDEACVFLTARGSCGVHRDRPLVCRIYPLAHQHDDEGRESFGRLAPDPQTEGVYGNAGTVASFLEQQGYAPYSDAAARYMVVYLRMIEALERLDPAELARGASRRADVGATAPGFAASDWIDIDRTVAAYCKASGRPMPDTVEATVAVHVEAIEAWIASL